MAYEESHNAGCEKAVLRDRWTYLMNNDVLAPSSPKTLCIGVFDRPALNAQTVSCVFERESHLFQISRVDFTCHPQSNSQAK